MGALRGIWSIQVCRLEACYFLSSGWVPKIGRWWKRSRTMFEPHGDSMLIFASRHWQKSRAKHVFFAFFLEVAAEFLHWHHLSEEEMGPMEWHEWQGQASLKLWLFKLVLSSAANLLIEISSWTFNLKLLPFDIPLWFYDELDTIDHANSCNSSASMGSIDYPKYRSVRHTSPQP